MKFVFGAKKNSSKMAEKLPKEGKKPKEVEPLIFTEKLLECDFDEVYNQYPLSEETRCGFGFFRGQWMQM